MLVKDMGLNVFPVPLHQVSLRSKHMEGEVALAVRPGLPVRGVQVILGNDLVDGPFSVSVPSPVVTPSPVVGSVDVECNDRSPIFPVCPVTRSQMLNKVDVMRKDKSVSHVTFLLPAFPLSVSRSGLIEEQQRGPTLAELFQQVQPGEVMESVAHGYFLDTF